MKKIILVLIIILAISLTMSCKTAAVIPDDSENTLFEDMEESPFERAELETIKEDIEEKDTAEEIIEEEEPLERVSEEEEPTEETAEEKAEEEETVEEEIEEATEKEAIEEEKEDNSKATLYNQLDNISEEYNQAWNFFNTTYEEGPGVGIAQYDDPQWIAFDETYLAKQKELLSKLQSLNWLNYTEEKGTIIHYAHTLCAYFQAYIDSAKNHDPNGYNENWKKWGDLYFGDFTEYYNSVLEKLK